MENFIIVGSLTVVALFLLWWLFFRRKNLNTFNKSDYDKVQTTSLNIVVRSVSGVNPDILDSIDAAWQAAHADALASGYTEKLNPVEYLVYADTDCVPSPEQNTPSFKLRADNYDGTDFDQYNPSGRGVKDGIGVIYASEMVVDSGLGSPYQATAEIVACAANIRTSARYGFEHILAIHNDSAYYNRTATHLEGGHPILPQTAPYNPTKIVNGVFVPRIPGN
jgi:hypothetical protein